MSASEISWSSTLVILTIKFCLPDENGEKKVDAKMNLKMETFGRMNEFEFWILHVKIRLHINFHENLRKKILIYFLKQFWLIKAKAKMNMKKIGKMSMTFKFSWSKLGYMAVFMKIWGKNV